MEHEVSQTGWGSKLGRPLGIVVLFFLLGPPIGALAFSTIGALGALVMGQSGTTAAMIFHGAIVGIVFSWFVGGFQAFIAGAAMAIFELVTRRQSLAVPMIAGLVAGIPYMIEEDLGGGLSTLLLIIHLVASLGCGLLVKATWKPMPPVPASV
ncbi:MAG: hypothetical protein KL863_19735 [Rhizobium sp.]|nr:hypothetical protein [Rhizobium sp.]